MIVQRFKVAARIREKSAVVQFLYDFPLYAQAFFCKIHKIVKALEKFLLVVCKVAYLRKVYGNDAQRACKFVRTEKSAATTTTYAWQPSMWRLGRSSLTGSDGDCAARGLL